MLPRLLTSRYSSSDAFLRVEAVEALTHQPGCDVEATSKMSRPSNTSNNEIKIQFHELTPAFRAYIFGYVTTTLPRLATALQLLLRPDIGNNIKLKLLESTLRATVGLNRFPTACAVIVAGSTILPRLLVKALLGLNGYRLSSRLTQLLIHCIRYATPICSFTSAWTAFALLNKDEQWARKRANSRSTRDQTSGASYTPRIEIQYAGKTIDLTCFAACRALDIIAIRLWIKLKAKGSRSRSRSASIAKYLEPALKAVADPSIFALSSAVIMWAWFYAPERLPRTYNTWITKIAELDYRLLHALRLCRQGDFVYGDRNSADADLPSLCADLGLPTQYGNPAVTIPIPCELYHCGTGKSCEVHAATRFRRSFNLAARLYFPLQLFSLLQSSPLTPRRVLSALRSAIRSSSFLASFVALFYYSVCLARTRLGPKLVSSKIVTPQIWDSGLCVLAGCLACGWSILFEKPSRRQEIAFFVAPRALATLLPRVYDQKHQQKEQLVFATSIALIMSTLQSRHQSSIRGVFGNLLRHVMS